MRGVVRVGLDSCSVGWHLNPNPHPPTPSNTHTQARSKDKFETERPTLSIYGPPGIYNLLCATISLTHSALSCNVSVYEYEMDNPPTTRRSVWARTQALATPSAQFAHPRITRIPVQEASKGVWELPSVQTRHNHDTRTLSIRAVATRHTVPSVSYVFEESTLQGTIDAKKTTALGLPPGREYRMLKQGKDVELPDGRIVRAADVVTPPIRGRKIVVAADTYVPCVGLIALVCGRVVVWVLVRGDSYATSFSLDACGGLPDSSGATPPHWSPMRRTATC